MHQHFEHIDVVAPFSVYGEFANGSTLTAVVNDVNGIARRIAIPAHILSKLSSTVFHIIKAKMPFGMRHFVEDAQNKSAESLIASLAGTADMLGQDHAGILEARVKKLKLTKLVEWPW